MSKSSVSVKNYMQKNPPKYKIGQLITVKTISKDVKHDLGYSHDTTMIILSISIAYDNTLKNGESTIYMYGYQTSVYSIPFVRGQVVTVIDFIKEDDIVLAHNVL